MSEIPDLSVPHSWVSQLLKHCAWEERFKLAQLNKTWHSELEGNQKHWRQLCLLLAEEERLYLSKHTTDTTEDWKAFFADLWTRKGMWDEPKRLAAPLGSDEAADEASEELDIPIAETKQFRFQVRVCARFRASPPQDAAQRKKEANAALVVLPLHQRIQMIKARFSTEISTTEAARILMEEMGTPSRDPWEAAVVLEQPADNDDGKDQLEAVMDSSDSPRSVLGTNHKASILNVKEGANGTVLAVAPGCGLRDFTFNTVLGCKSTQMDVYTAAAIPLLNDFLNGFNGTMLTYGQTGSGKTYTMFGPYLEGKTCIEGKQRGVLPRICEEVLAAIQARQELGLQADLSMSYVEVFGQEVYDLLREGVAVGQNRVAGQRYVLDGKCEVEVSNMEEVGDLLQIGEEQKRKAATVMNERSTRAHSLVVLSLKQADIATGATHQSRLILADLGGSEQLSKSKANEGAKAYGEGTWAEYYEARERLTEAAYINYGLFALKKCIDALNAAQEARQKGRPQPYVPYQDSKLTQLLSGALGGDSRTTVVVTGSMEAQHAVETVQSLRFGERCSNIENLTHLTGAALKAALAEIDAEIADIESLILKNERWEQRRIERVDLEGKEVLVKFVLVGAEQERDHLEALLKRKRQLLGEAEPDKKYQSYNTDLATA